MTEFFTFLLLWDIVVNEVVERIEVFLRLDLPRFWLSPSRPYL